MAWFVVSGLLRNARVAPRVYGPFDSAEQAKASTMGGSGRYVVKGRTPNDAIFAAHQKAGLPIQPVRVAVRRD